jgi:lipopolysaccharide/colanic/teichoic acid biosynthesis glycosyltransferase
MVRTENIADKKVYAYKRVMAAPETEEVPGNLSYLYIGNRFRNALELHSGFSTSHFRFTVDEGKKLLLRLEAAGQLPGVILLDGEFGTAALRSFLLFLKESEALNAITVLAEISQCSSHQVNRLSSEPGITDVVNIREKDVLMQKAIFHGKLNRNPETIRENLNEGFNFKMVSQYGLIRLFDIVFSSVCMMVLSPLMLLIAGLVRAEAGNNIFEYSTERGLRYRTFRYIRFRTEPCLQPNQLPDLVHLNQYIRGHEDAKLAAPSAGGRIGSVLKRTGLDQLPALFNILAGDLSFIRSR